MFTVLSNTRNANLYIITALAIMIVVLLTFAVVPSISVREPAAISETSSQNAYVQFLSGEKLPYGNSARLSEALAAYHLGERAVSAITIDWINTLPTYRLGEKVLYGNPARLSEALAAYHQGEKAVSINAVEWNSALATYLAGEKAIYTNLADNAISVWSSGEKAILPFDVVEQALWTHRMGEKGLK